MKHHQIPEKVRGEGPKSDFLLQLVAIWVYQSIPFKGLHITTTKSLIPVPPGHMAAQSIFSLECFLAVVAIVTEIAREVGAFNVVPHIVPNKSLLPADGALEGRAPVIEHGVLQILVKHFSCIRRPCTLIPNYKRLCKVWR